MENKNYEAPRAEILSFENDYIFAALHQRNDIDLSLEPRYGNTSYVPV